MARKLSPAERASEIFELPAESFAGVPKLTVTGRRYAIVEHHRGLSLYTKERIEVEGGRVRLCISGTDLSLTAMDREVLILRGEILSAEFE
ncbi:MAG: YabP/YqfC family sporulation protein [Oscillospiraceae bacterium]|nr:YabP/YqfC family sporulation protein [Oscillospiraceae bacterium]